jgi:hypothetical protein
MLEIEDEQDNTMYNDQKKKTTKCIHDALHKELRLEQCVKTISAKQIRRWGHVFWKGKQFVLHWWNLSCYCETTRTSSDMEILLDIIIPKCMQRPQMNRENKSPSCEMGMDGVKL